MQNEAYMKHIQLILEKVSNSHAHITDNFRFDRNLCKGGSGVEWGWDPCGQYISLKGFLALYGRGKNHQCELAHLPCLTRKLS
jgi:hypothetical protein